MAEAGTPRRTVEPDATRALAAKLARLERAVAALGKTADLRNASITDAAGVTRLRFSSEDAAILAYDSTGAEVARYGLLAHSDPGAYGIEALAGDTWIHVGNQSMTWDNVVSKPSAFAPAAHTHPGADVTSAVASAGSAGSAATAGMADGSQYGWTNPVAGSEFYALWVGNDGGFHFGRNTSSLRYKENVRDFVGASTGLAQLRPVIYDRKPTYTRPSVDGIPVEGPAVEVPGAVDEFGLIAEEVFKVWPEVITFFDHGDGKGPVVDSIRYDLLGVRLIPIIQAQETRLAALEKRAASQDTLIAGLTSRIDALEAKP